MDLLNGTLSNSAKPLKSCVVEELFLHTRWVGMFPPRFYNERAAFFSSCSDKTLQLAWRMFFYYYFFYIGNFLPAIVLRKLCRELSIVLSKRTTCNNKLGVLFAKQRGMFLSYLDVSQMFMSLQLHWLLVSGNCSFTLYQNINLGRKSWCSSETKTKGLYVFVNTTVTVIFLVITVN